MKISSLYLLLACIEVFPMQEAEYTLIACDHETEHVNDRSEVALVMINDLEEEVKIYWMNARKQRTEYASLFKGEEFPINSATNHYWVIESKSGCLCIIRPKTSGEIYFSKLTEESD